MIEYMNILTKISLFYEISKEYNIKLQKKLQKYEKNVISFKALIDIVCSYEILADNFY